MLQACAGQPFSVDDKGLIDVPAGLPDTLMMDSQQMKETGELTEDPGTGKSLAAETYSSTVPPFSENKKGASQRLPKIVWPATISPTSKSVTLLRELQGLTQGIGVI